jgi:transcriptional regulator with XRE-family HTH domain
MDYMINFQNTLRKLVAEKGIALSRDLDVTAYLEEITGSNRYTTMGWFNGRYTPSLKNLLKLADHFGCSVDYLFGLDEKREFKPNKTAFPFFERMQLLLKENNVSHNRLARDCGFNPAIVAKWQKGQLPGTPTLIVLTTYFKRPIEYIIGRQS